MYLDSVTLCCIETRCPSLGLHAMMQSMAQLRFVRGILFTCEQFDPPLDCEIDIIVIDIPDISSYSRFVLQRLHQYITTEHALIVQWDGFVTDGRMWRDIFLTFDYIGARWPHFSDAISVGNGGFSLRSARLLQATATLDYEGEIAEDLYVCHTMRSTLENDFALRFADTETADAFAYERFKPERSCFGFHGLFNLPDFMAPAALSAFIRKTPAHMLRSKDAQDLAHRLADEAAMSGTMVALRISLARMCVRPFRLKDAALLRDVLRTLLKRVAAALHL